MGNLFQDVNHSFVGQQSMLSYKVLFDQGPALVAVEGFQLAGQDFLQCGPELIEVKRLAADQAGQSIKSVVTEFVDDWPATHARRSFESSSRTWFSTGINRVRFQESMSFFLNRKMRALTKTCT